MADHVKPIRVEGMAVPMGHYSDAVLAGDTLYISGVIAADQTGAQDFFGDHRPASTLVEVAALVEPEVLIEVDAVAVVESRQSD